MTLQLQAPPPVTREEATELIKFLPPKDEVERVGPAAAVDAYEKLLEAATSDVEVIGPEGAALELVEEWPGAFTPGTLRRRLRELGHGRGAAWMAVETLFHHAKIHRAGGRVHPAAEDGDARWDFERARDQLDRSGL
jgi:hypothetical protein